MAQYITDELLLLIRAEADKAIKEAQKYGAAVDGAEKSNKKFINTEKLKKKALQTGKLAALAAAAAMVKYAYDSEMAFAQAQGEARKFAITFADSLREAEQVAKAWAGTFGYAESSARALIGSAGDIFTGMGMAGSAALDLADKTAYLGGALSKFSPQTGSAADAVQALVSATTGEREALKRWGVIIQETAVQTKLLENGQQNLTGSALLAAKAEAVLEIAYEQSPNALRGVASATELVADTNRRLAEAWKENKELAGEQVSKVFQPIKGALTDMIQASNEARKAQKELFSLEPNWSQIEAYQETADSIDKLLKEYDDLKGKTSLSVDEQDRLKDVINDIADIVPSAVTAWDDYGDAIEIAGDKAQKFADSQRQYRLMELKASSYTLKAAAETAEEQIRIDQETLATKKAQQGALQAKLEPRRDIYNALIQSEEVALKLVGAGGDDSKIMERFETRLDYLKEHYSDMFAGFDIPLDVVWKPDLNGIVQTNTITNTIKEWHEQVQAIFPSEKDATGWFDVSWFHAFTDQEAEFGTLTTTINDLNESIAQGELAIGDYALNLQETAYLSGDLDDLLAALTLLGESDPNIQASLNGYKAAFDAGALSVEDYKKSIESLYYGNSSTASDAPAPELYDTTTLDTAIQGIERYAINIEALGGTYDLATAKSDLITAEFAKLAKNTTISDEVLQDFVNTYGDFITLDTPDLAKTLSDQFAEIDKLACNYEIAGFVFDADGAKSNAATAELELLLADPSATQEEIEAFIADMEQQGITLTLEVDADTPALSSYQEYLKTLQSALSQIDLEAGRYDALGLDYDADSAKSEAVTKQLELILADPSVTQDQINSYIKGLEILGIKVGIKPVAPEDIGALGAALQGMDLEMVHEVGIALSKGDITIGDAISGLSAELAAGFEDPVIASAIEGIGNTLGTMIDTIANDGDWNRVAAEAISAVTDVISQVAGKWGPLVSLVGGLASGLFSAAAEINTFIEDSKNGIADLLADVFDAEEALAQARLDAIDEELRVLDEATALKLEILKDKWDRGKINADEYYAEASKIGAEAAAEADVIEERKEHINNQNKLINGIDGTILALQEKLDDMGFFEKWGTGDEKLEAEIEKYQKLLADLENDPDGISYADAKELARKYGISFAATGADFVTSGPQLLMVGENPGGREHVQVTPLSSPNINGPSAMAGVQKTEVNITIAGDVYGVEDLYIKLQKAGQQLARDHRVAI